MSEPVGIMVCAACLAESPAFATKREGRRWLKRHFERRHPGRRLPTEPRVVDVVVAPRNQG